MKKLVIVTGGTSGIGLEVVKKYLFTGDWNVISVSRGTNKIKYAKLQLGELANNCVFFNGDVFNEKDLDRLYEYIDKEYGKVDAIVNSAGIIHAGGIESLSEEDWTETLNINLTAPYMICKRFINLLKKVDSSSIVNISSISSKITGSSIAYSTCKAGLDMFTKTLAKELSKYNIRVNSVNPGIVNTGFQVSNELLDIEDYGHFLDEVAKTYPLGIGTATDIANMVYYLISDEAKWITGSIVIVDGGRSINI